MDSFNRLSGLLSVSVNGQTISPGTGIDVPVNVKGYGEDVLVLRFENEVPNRNIVLNKFSYDASDKKKFSGEYVGPVTPSIDVSGNTATYTN